MTIAVDMGRKETKQTNKIISSHICDKYKYTHEVALLLGYSLKVSH